jgi:hypothetical protein
VISANLQRRHLTTSQRAAIAVEIEPLFAAEAKQRKREGGSKGGKQSRRGERGNKVPAKTPEAYPAEPTPEPKSAEREARAQAAAAVGVSPRQVSDAKRLKEGAPELFEKVKADEMTVSKAAREWIKRRSRRDTG